MRDLLFLYNHPQLTSCRLDIVCFPLQGGVSFHQFWSKWWRSKSLFLPSCAGWCRSCIWMCDVHLVCTYVHNVKRKKKLKFYFEYRLKRNQTSVVITLSISIILLQPKMVCFKRSVRFVCLLEPCYLPSVTLPSYKYDWMVCFFFSFCDIWYT